LTLGFERRQESSAALAPESFLGGAALLRWCVAFGFAVAFPVLGRKPSPKSGRIQQ
jgi:hypothetical protein